MLLTYLDESYDKERYWMAALLCPDDQANSLTEALDSVVRLSAKSYGGLDWTAELHGHDLFQGRQAWEPLRHMPRARIGVYMEAFDAIAAHDVEVIIRGVHIPRLNARYAHPDHPHAVVLAHLLERVDERAERRDDRVLVIADEIDKADTYRRDLWTFQRASTTGYRARQLKRIVDTIHFAPSRASRLVQAADLIAYLHRRIKSGAEVDERAQRANGELWRRITPILVHSHCWYP